MNGANGETMTDMKRFLQFKAVNQESDKQTINEGFKLITEKYGNKGNNQLKLFRLKILIILTKIK